MSEEFGVAWRRLNYDFMVLDKSPNARFAALPSASAVGQCAQVATMILQEAASKIRADEGGRDHRLVNAWQRVQDNWPDELRNVLLDKYSERRALAKYAYEVSSQRKEIIAKGIKMLRREEPKSSWVSYLQTFRAALEETARDRPMREV